MRIWRAHEIGEPADVMKLGDADAPSPLSHEVLVRVEAVGLNFPDILQCRGGYQVKPTFPFGVGSEVAGVVSQVGTEVTTVRVGDRVAGSIAGGLAEQVVIRADAVLPMSDTIPAAKAAAMITNYTTSHYALHDRAHIQPGETLLVHAGAGGVGSAAIQLGLAAGARVFATAGGGGKVRTCKELGAEIAIDYTSEDIVERIRDATDGQGVDVVYDPVGGDVFDQSRRVVGWNGRYLVIGFTSGRIPSAPMNHVLLKNYSLVGVHWGVSAARQPGAMRKTFGALVDLYDEGRIDPLIFRGAPLPMAGAAEALTLLASRRTTGKIVIDPTR